MLISEIFAEASLNGSSTAGMSLSRRIATHRARRDPDSQKVGQPAQNPSQGSQPASHEAPPAGAGNSAALAGIGLPSPAM
jgi:hypothetical protein